MNSHTSHLNKTKLRNELFYPELKKLNSVNKTITYTDSIYGALKLKNIDTAVYAEIINETLKKRFKHGLSTYALSENWIAYYLGKLSWSHFSVIVDAEDILKHSEGLCSQQNIVFITILKQKGITYRKIGLGKKRGPGHFVIEILYNRAWHLYDIDLEPDWTKIDNSHKSLNYLLANKNELYTIYKDKINTNLLNEVIVEYYYEIPNKLPAKNMLFFHKITKIVTYILPITFLLLSLYSIKKAKKI